MKRILVHLKPIVCLLALLPFFDVAQAGYPQTIDLLDQNNASYDTPEKAIASFFSAYMAGDLTWHYETLTVESAELEKDENERNNLDPRTEIDIFRKGFSSSFIVDKFKYLDTVVIVVRILDINGDVFTIPYTLIIENDAWKVTRKYPISGELAKHMKVEPNLFLGYGQRPSDVNVFLAYHYPQQAKTRLPAGTSTFDLHIFFGITILPSTLSVTLDGQDISSLFSPSPSSDQMVTINLKPGRNVMRLSVEGKRLDGKIATDSDRLVFVVQ